MAVTTEVLSATPAGDSTPSAWRFYVQVLSTIMTVIVVTVACVAVVVAAATHLSPKGQYTVFGHPVMVVLSGSMSPAIRTGDLIVDYPVTGAEAQNLHVGQIVTVRESTGSNTAITHRIVGVEHKDGHVAYITKGDVNSAADTTHRSPADVVGVFSHTVRHGGYVLYALHKPLVLGLLIASPLLWFAAAPLKAWGRRMDDGEQT